MSQIKIKNKRSIQTPFLFSSKIYFLSFCFDIKLSFYFEIFIILFCVLQDINLVTHIISGALNELSLYITKTSPINKKDLYTAISKLLKGFKIESN